MTPLGYSDWYLLKVELEPSVVLSARCRSDYTVFLSTWKDPSGHGKQWENKLRFYINGQHCVIYKERAREISVDQSKTGLVEKCGP